jgi:hypothetical protein
LFDGDFRLGDKGAIQRSFPPFVFVASHAFGFRVAAQSPFWYRVGACVVKLNAAIVVFVGLISAAYPIHAEPEPVRDAGLAASRGVKEAVRLPDFVPVVNFDQFLLAYQQDGSGEMDGVAPAPRAAAEALSARFAPPSLKSDSQFLQVVVQQDPIGPNILDAATDPKVPGRIASLAGVEKLGARQDAVDPKKADFLIASSGLSSGTGTADASVEPQRRHARLSRRSIVARTRSARKGFTPRQARRVASAEPAQRSGSAYTGGGPDLDHIVGFGTLTPDNRLSN